MQWLFLLHFFSILGSVSNMNLASWAGWHRKGAIVNLLLSSPQDFCCSSYHMNSWFLSVSFVRCLATVAKSCTNLLWYEHKPKKDLISFMVCGLGQSATTSIFSGSVSMPWSLTTWPKCWTFFLTVCTCFNFRPAALRLESSRLSHM